MAAGVAIVGAGMAGAACARYLADRGGFTVTLFDKGRSVGGRLAQRRAAGAVLDHGAQYIGVREPAFAELARAWCKAGLAAEWPAVRSGSGDPVLVGTPAMNAPVKALLAGLTVRTGTRVTAVRRRAGGWILSLDDGAEAAGFACLVVAVPAPQAAALLGRGLDPVRMAPCWSALVVPTAGLPGETHRLDDPVLAWAARSDRKPGRGGPEAWTLHATPAWSRAQLESPAAEVAAALLHRFADLAGVPVPATAHLSAHRWRHALVERALGRPHVWEAESGLGLCGDWCLGPRVEAAWLSGRSLGAAIAG